MSDFLKLRDSMQKKYGDSSVMLVSDIPVRPPLPSASLALDFAMGGGLPPDRVVEIAGQEGTGKSSLGLLSMANFLDAQPDRGAVILDLEHKITASWVEQLIGKDRMERVILGWPSHVEEATDMYMQAVSTGEISFVLIDSIGGAPSQRVTEKSAEIGNIGGNALSITRLAQLASIQSQKMSCLTMGINQTRDDMQGYNRMVCLAGETKVLTRKGFRPIAELAGSEHEILTENSVWTTAYVGEYGQDEMWEIEIERYGVRRTIRANGPHRWPIRRHALYHHRPAEMAPNHSLSKGSCPDPDCPLRGQCHCPLYCGIKTSVPRVNSEQRGWTKGVPLQFTKGHRASMTGLGHGGSVGLGERQMVKTYDLQEGDYLTTNTPRFSFKAGELLKWAVAWGFVFGDGTRGQGYGSLLIHDSAPKDRDILPFFDSFNVSRHSDHTRVYGFPNTFKHLPDHSEPEMFLYGWLAGYFAADGEIDRDGCASFCSSSRKNLEFVEDVCAKLGIVTGNIVDQKYGAGAYNPGETYHTLTFPVGALPKEFFVLGSHKRNWKPATATKVRWRVMGVRPTRQVERIYCASVPETETFTLQDYILTGNTPGGRGWKHACVIRVQLKRGQGKIEEKVNGEVMQVGYEIVAKVVKNQLAPQGRTANYWFMSIPTEKWGFGIDRLEEIVRIGLLTALIGQGGAYYYEEGLPDGKIKSKEALSHYVRDNPDYYKYLSTKVMDLVTKDGEMANLVAPMGEADED